MAEFNASTKDILFTLKHVADLNAVFALPNKAECSTELLEAIVEEAARVAKHTVAPTNQPGDQKPAQLIDGQVQLAEGWQASFDALAEGGWIGLDVPDIYGGQNLTTLVATAIGEIWQSANLSFSLCNLLTVGAIEALLHTASDEQKLRFIPKLVSGEWTGTMNLTEPQAGSDLSALTTRAVPQDDHYRIFGQKIFITYGDHNLAKNILHLVLARTPDAPPGVKGISLFAVPKFLLDGQDQPGAANDVRCVSIEHKLGIHGSPTAVMSYGDNQGAVGYLIGEENRGLEYMFVMMNRARFDVGLQGLSIADRAWQHAQQYAHERVQGTPSGYERGTTIAGHADVKRMLLTMKSRIEAMRSLIYASAVDIDCAHSLPVGAEKTTAQSTLEFLTPIVKGWCSETGQDITSLGIQIHGGVGYVEETGAAQYFRDARITTIYEGTTGIQANDLVFRKTMLDQGKSALYVLQQRLSEMTKYANDDDATIRQLGQSGQQVMQAAQAAVNWVLDQAGNKTLLGFIAVPYLLLLGNAFAHAYLVRGAVAARGHILAGDNSEFMRNKVTTALFHGTLAMADVLRNQHLLTSDFEQTVHQPLSTFAA